MARFPRIEDGHACWLEIGHVARDYCHAMHQCRRRNERVTLAAFVGYVQSGAALRHGGIDTCFASHPLLRFQELLPLAA